MKVAFNRKLKKSILVDGRGFTKASLLGVVKRTDGAAQVTYNGHPLYTDEGP